MVKAKSFASFLEDNGFEVMYMSSCYKAYLNNNTVLFEAKPNHNVKLLVVSGKDIEPINQSIKTFFENQNAKVVIERNGSSANIGVIYF